MTDGEWFASFRKKSFKFWSSSLPPYVHMVGGKGGWTFATMKCLLLVVIWPFSCVAFNFSCSWRHCIQISQICVWSARNDATSDNWVLPIIKCPPVKTLRREKHSRHLKIVREKLATTLRIMGFHDVTVKFPWRHARHIRKHRAG